MNLYESTPTNAIKHGTKLIKHVIERKAANKVVDKAISSGKGAIAAHKAKPKGSGLFANIHSPFEFFLHFPIVFPILLVLILVGGYFGLNMLWKKLDTKYNIGGLPLAPWKDYVRKIRAIMFKEDLTQFFIKPVFLAQKFPKYTWKSFWKLMILVITGEFLLLFFIPNIIIFVLLIPIAIACLLGTNHIKQIFGHRMRTLMQMFEVAEAVMKYQKGANLNPWGYIIIQSWGNPEAPNFTATDNLYSPGPTYVMFNAKFPSDDQRNRDAFERNFNGTVSDQHTWTYEWESANNRVLCTPVPFIPATIVPYPFPDRKPWNIFPLGEAAGGKEAFFDVKVFPHLLVAGVTGSGKAQEIYTKLPVPISLKNPTGWTTLKDIQIGDRVFDEKGNPCNVFGISEIKDTQLYRVYFSDNTYLDSSADHLWRTEDRVSLQSRWRSQREFQRRELLSKEGKESLTQLLATLDPKDEMTVEQIASYAKVHPTSTWLYDLAREIGQVGEVKIVAEFHYNEQIVKQRQKVTRYPAKQTWEALSAYKARPGSIFALSQNKFATLALSVSQEETVSSIEVAREVGYPTLTQARSLLRRVGIKGEVGIEIVELKVPAKTLTRETRFASTYPAIELIEAVLELGKKIVNDQRDKGTYSAIRTTQEIMETLYTPNGKYLNHSILVAPALDLPGIELPIPSYTLGAWLGDGTSANSTICGMDHEVARMIEAEGFTLVEHKVKDTSGAKPRNKDFRIWNINGLVTLLRAHNLRKNKHIPTIYLRASIEQRRALLAGLLDTDGNVGASGGVEFTNTNREIAYGTLELARSLGYRATIIEGRAKLYGKDCGPKWTVAFTCAESPFRLTRKTETFNERGVNKNSEKTDRKYITNVEKIESAPARCIQVDSPSRMFLAGEGFTATHNSVTQRTLLMHALQSPDWRIALVDPKRVELSSYKTHPHVVAVATELDESMALIEKVEQEMQSRYIAMQKEGVNFFKNLETSPPALLLMVDETYALLAPEKIKNDEGKERDEWHARITLLIGSIARLGRAAGVHMILATQRPDAAVLPGETKANLDARIAQGRMDSTPSNMTLDSDAATRIPNIKGRAVLRTGNDFTEFQAYFLPEQQLDLVLEMAGALATGAVDISAFDDDEPVREDEGKKRFSLSKLSLKSIRLPRLPKDVKGRLGEWMEGRKALAHENDARSKAATEGAITSKKGSGGRGGSESGEEDSSSQRGSRGLNRGRKRSPLPQGLEDDELDDEEIDINAIANAAKARGPIGGMNLNPNDSSERSDNLMESEDNLRARVPMPTLPTLPVPLDYADADEINFEEFDDEHNSEDPLEYQEFPQSKNLTATSKAIQTVPIEETVLESQKEQPLEEDAEVETQDDENDENDENGEDERERNIRLAASQEEETLRRVNEINDSVPVPIAVPIAPYLPYDLEAMSVEEVLIRAAQKGVRIPASELLAALRYEVMIEAAGGKTQAIPVPVIQSKSILETVPIPMPIHKTEEVLSTKIFQEEVEPIVAVPMPIYKAGESILPSETESILAVPMPTPIIPLPKSHIESLEVPIISPIPLVSPISIPIPIPKSSLPVATPSPSYQEELEEEDEIIEAPWMPKKNEVREDNNGGSTPFGNVGKQ